MLEKLVYINHLNERFELGKDGVYVSTHELRNYKWTVKKQNDRIASLARGVTSYKIPIVFVGKTAAESNAARNRLYEIIDKDAAVMQYGKFVIGDYYLKGIVTESRKREWLRAGRHMREDLTVTTDHPAWVKETRHVLRKSGGQNVGGRNFDYPTDYAFDFTTSIGSEKIVNQSVAPSNFRMMFYGPCVDPEVEIGGHLYRVYGEVQAREAIVIDSVEKTIYLLHADGTKENRFNNRYRRSYIFQPIDIGPQSVFWGGVYDIDVVTFDERSEPKWI